jgi:hypothetical protein
MKSIPCFFIRSIEKKVQGSRFRVQGSRFRVQRRRWLEKQPVKSK